MKTISKANILKLIPDYYSDAFPDRKFTPGKDKILTGGRVFDDKEISYAVDACLDFWLTNKNYTEKFERIFREYIGVGNAIFVNSGSSANLLAVGALTSKTLGKRAIEKGSEIITIAAGFPTTVNPIVQYGCIPVFVDVTIPEYNVDVSQLQEALSSKTKAVILPHTLGNPFNVSKVLEFTIENNLWLIEDCCDALGSLYNNGKCGSFGDLATFSFYPAHHLTTGEGGMVVTNDCHLAKLVTSFRDWGRDCICKSGCDNQCGKRFSQQFADMPYGYDHKYIYSEIGYNLKATDIQAAIGIAQMEKLSSFIEVRKDNFNYLYNLLKDSCPSLILPHSLLESETSWFGFPIAINDNNYNLSDMVTYLNNNKVCTRLLFAGNITKQPSFRGVEYRVVSDLKNTDFVMNNVFWVGVYPGVNKDMLDYVSSIIHRYQKEKNEFV